MGLLGSLCNRIVAAHKPEARAKVAGVSFTCASGLYWHGRPGLGCERYFTFRFQTLIDTPAESLVTNSFGLSTPGWA